MSVLQKGPDLVRQRRRPDPIAPARADSPEGARTFWGIWLLALSTTVLFAVVAAMRPGPGQTTELWLVATVAFTWVTMSWQSDTLLPRLTSHMVLTVLSLAGVGVLTGTLMQAGLAATVLSAIGIPLQAITMASFTTLGRRWLRVVPHPPVEGASPWRSAWAERWAPSGAKDLFALAYGALASAVVSLLVGAVPGVHFSALDAAETAQWVSHILVVSIVGGAATLIIFPTWSEADRAHPWFRIAAIWVASVSVLLWVHAANVYSVAWLQIIPTLFIALTCRLWVTATFSLSLGAVSVLLSPQLNEIDHLQGDIPLGTSMDLLVATLIMTALVLAFLDQRRDDLMADLHHERAKTASHLSMMQTTFEAMHDGVLVMSADRTLQFHNSAASHLLGQPFPTTRPDDWSRHFGASSLDGDELRDQDLPRHDHVVVTTPDGRRVLQQRIVRLGPFTGDSMMVVLSDITEQWARMDELSGFAGVVAHDMRAPLTSLEGWLELASEALEDEQFEEAEVMLQRARAGNRRMRQIIDDWLDYTVDRQGTLDVSVFSLALVVKAVMSNLAESGPHRFTLDVHHEVAADQATVRQVLANLIGNASKFSRPGTTPQIAVRSFDAKDSMVRIEVEDRGIGLPPGLEEEIFVEYRRGGGAATRVEGFGLGLALCKRVVERHGGTIHAQNNSYGGATFVFTLPGADSTLTVPSAWEQPRT